MRENYRLCTQAGHRRGLNWLNWRFAEKDRIYKQVLGTAIPGGVSVRPLVPVWK
jgi:hypothetical protein